MAYEKTNERLNERLRDGIFNSFVLPSWRECSLDKRH
jgi:hypothetical protein